MVIRKIIPIIALLLMNICVSKAEVVDSTTHKDADSIKSNNCLFIALDYMGLNNNSTIRGARLNYKLTNPNFNLIESSVATVAVQTDRNEKVKISYNSISYLLGEVAIRTLPYDATHTVDFYKIVRGIFLAQVIIHTFTNPSFKISLAKNYVDLLIGVNTDYFFFYDVSRIYSEASIGLRGRLKNIALSANLGIPFTKGYFENKAPYLGASAYYIF